MNRIKRKDRIIPENRIPSEDRFTPENRIIPEGRIPLINRNERKDRIIPENWITSEGRITLKTDYFKIPTYTLKNGSLQNTGIPVNRIKRKGRITPPRPDYRIPSVRRRQSYPIPYLGFYSFRCISSSFGDLSIRGI